ncbi:hypothetical protein QP179_10140 [Sphingomonas aurantiaca]|uniref:hypothetical protein n=1 Tax=Sphingomonas aurantiaca TaxID=185949 RepID=UPI002FE3AFC7
MDKDRSVHFTEGTLKIGLEYMRFGGSTVHLTPSEHLLLCAIFDACSKGITIAAIGMHIGAGFSNDMSSLINSHVHTTRKKLFALSNGLISIKWKRKTQSYHLVTDKDV